MSLATQATTDWRPRDKVYLFIGMSGRSSADQIKGLICTLFLCAHIHHTTTIASAVVKLIMLFHFIGTLLIEYPIIFEMARQATKGDRCDIPF
jgi:hypothetical protein